MYGPGDARLHIFKKYFPNLQLVGRGHQIKISGPTEEIEKCEKKIQEVIRIIQRKKYISDEVLVQVLKQGAAEEEMPFHDSASEVILFGKNGGPIKARTPNQQKLISQTGRHDLVFAVGPAGTGKTFIAVALAVRALKNKEVKKIILTRPAVEAGENLGFLPGDLKEKLDPYLQPLYDALRDMLPGERLSQYIETGIIEIAPLAFMRGRTLHHSFVILDEAQNTTCNQMKMFLTRMGQGSKFIVTGDTTQSDLPKNQSSGLLQALDLLRNTGEIGIVFLGEEDIVRHELVKKIVHAYNDKDPARSGQTNNK